MSRKINLLSPRMRNVWPEPYNRRNPINLYDFYSKNPDKALEDISFKIHQWAGKRPIVGYVQSNSIADILREIVNSKKQNPEKKYMFDCQIHQNEIQLIERILSEI